MIRRFCKQLFLSLCTEIKFSDPNLSGHAGLLLQVDYLVCTEVDMKFRDHVSMEILSPLLSTLHRGFYWAAHKDFSYEHQPQSQAHTPRDQGDFFYMGAFFRGSAIGFDLASGIEALWHDESHLNTCLLDHKSLLGAVPGGPVGPAAAGLAPS
ncbi:hypothetical protein GH733_012185 [Mirounga leonina]|nr:hypothetical protein GH733_012185 [Mirounga leonina]